MARKGGWRRVGSKGRFRHEDERGRRIADPEKLERIESLAIPPAWRDVWISPRPNAKLQATGVDRAGRRQYLYHPDYRAARERAKYDRLVLFAERLPELRRAMAEHLDAEPLSHERVSAVALRLIDLGWFRAGSECHARGSRTHGITTLTKRHVTVRGSRIRLRFRGKNRMVVRTAVVDSELAAELKELRGLRGGRRVFRYASNGRLVNLTNAGLNNYVHEYLGDESTAKDFRTWGGTLLAAIGLAERGIVEGESEARRVVTAVMRSVAERLGNTPAVCHASYVSPAVVDHYLEGRTLEDFRPRHLRVVAAREIGLDPEERALLDLLRSWRIRRARAAA